MTHYKAFRLLTFFLFSLVLLPPLAFSELTCEDLPLCTTAAQCTDPACPACFPSLPTNFCTTCCGLDQDDCELIQNASGLGPCVWNGTACDDSNNPCNLIPETPKPIRKFLPLILGAFFLTLLGSMVLFRKRAKQS